MSKTANSKTANSKTGTVFSENSAKRPRVAANAVRRSRFALKLAAAAQLFWLSGCGFHPLYGEHSQAEQKLAGIDVAIIPDRTGQILRQELQRRLQGANKAPAAYTLNVSISLHTDIAGVIATNSVASYQRLSATGTWTLHPVGNPQITTAKGTALAVDAENILNQQYFAADLETTAVNDHLMVLLADQITAELAAKLSEPPAQAKPAVTKTSSATAHSPTASPAASPANAPANAIAPGTSIKASPAG